MSQDYISRPVAEFLASEGGQATSHHPSLRKPRDAATIILLDRTGTAPKVLMGKRHAGHVFMAGKYVFPGGRVDPSDGRMNVFGMLDEKVEARLLTRMQRPSSTRARALGLAAVRELAEETGLLIGSRDAGPPPAPSEAWKPFAEHGVFPSLDGLVFVARAITPPNRPRRYDTRFFAADAEVVAHRVEGIVGPEAELVDLVWVSLKEAQSLDLPMITRTVLADLERRLESGLMLDQPVPFYRAVRGLMVREEL